MITSIQPRAGSWILLVGPRSLNTTILNAIARLGDGGPVCILDGGNRFNAYTVARAAHGRPEVLNRIMVSRAFTCYQVLSLLESMSYPQDITCPQGMSSPKGMSIPKGAPETPLPPDTLSLSPPYQSLPLLSSGGTHVPGSWGMGVFIVLDLLSTFYDESVQVGERKRLLRACITHLEYLELRAGGVISVHPPKIPSQPAVELLEMLQASAADTYYIQPDAPAPEPLRLF